MSNQLLRTVCQFSKYSNQRPPCVLTVGAFPDSPDGVGVSGQLGDGHLADLQSVPEHPQGGAGAAAAQRVHLGRVLVRCGPGTGGVTGR